MTSALLVDLTIFVLSLWVGFEVISKVPATLHTPLMSAANSIHGIVLAGAMLIAVTANNAVGYVIAFVAAAFAAANVVGGYVVTGRMLKMFKRRPATPPPGAGHGGVRPPPPSAARGQRQRAARVSTFAWITQLLYVAVRVLLRAGPAPDEQPGHRPPRQSGLDRGHGHGHRRDPGHRHPLRRHHRDRLGRDDRRGRWSARASACTQPGPCR